MGTEIMTKDEVLEVMVTEYKVLRQELYKIFDNQIKPSFQNYKHIMR